MLPLLVILALRAARIPERDKALWHGAHAGFALGEFIYHVVLAIGDYRDRKRSQ